MSLSTGARCLIVPSFWIIWNFTIVSFTIYATVLLLYRALVMGSYYTHFLEIPFAYKTYTLVVSLRLQFTNWFANVAKHCVRQRPAVNIGKINSLGNNGSRTRFKNIFRGITMGIGPIWGICSLSFILSYRRTYKGFPVFFSPEDKTWAPDVFSSCFFIPCAHLVTSLVMVSFYGYEILRHKEQVVKPILGEIHVFSTSVNNKIKSCG